MTQQSGGVGIPITQAVAGVLSGSILTPAFATNGTSPLFDALMNQLAADVTMTNANQWYDGPALVLTIGMWLVFATVTVQSPNVSNGVALRVYDGTSTYASTEWNQPIASGWMSLSLVARVPLVGSATVRAQAASSGTGASIKAAQSELAVGNNSSTLLAVRIA